ncbi:MAG TPA: VOC family protein, partial [Quisquiliibacterium sp.]|nr:VOC family protein [Quisquiliibacterium sp.]
MITGMPRIAIATGDFEGIVDTFRNRLGVPVIDLSGETVPSLGARIAMCVPKGGSNIELMSPEVASAPLSQSLQRFLDRRGQGPFALMLEAPDPDAEAEVLAARGLNVLPLMAGAGGRDVHPGSTHGVLIRVYPVDSFQGEAPAGTPAGALSGVQRVIIAVKDLEAAAKVYGERLGMPADAPALDPARGVESVLVHPPTGGTIELVAVRDRARPFAAAVAAHLDANPEGMYALVLQARDPRGMLDALRAKGLDARVAADSPDAIEIARGAMFG